MKFSKNDIQNLKLLIAKTTITGYSLGRPLEAVEAEESLQDMAVKMARYIVENYKESTVIEKGYAIKDTSNDYWIAECSSGWFITEYIGDRMLFDTKEDAKDYMKGELFHKVDWSKFGTNGNNIKIVKNWVLALYFLLIE